MRVISLQSGSKGNCIYLETEGVRLIFDAGITGKVACERLAGYDIDIKSVDAVFISHDHSDHFKYAGVFSRKFGHKVAMPEKTHRRHARWLKDIDIYAHFEPGERISVGEVTIETYPTPHDTDNSCAFVVEAGSKRLGILTDLGHVFEGLGDIISTLDAVMLESNYDPVLLEAGPYPWSLKQRIVGSGGHISNEDAGRLLEQYASPRLKWACLSHISENNNTYKHARETNLAILGHYGAKRHYHLLIARQDRAVVMPSF
ncbi:MAG: MBL fold metallo-hydrolase [Phycisphaerae bacterium]|jgi:phosphoribosyl 1,2-cyclic phosphodiesterase